MTAVETTFTNGLTNGVHEHLVCHKTTETSVYKEYMLKLLPHNPSWMTNNFITPKTVTGNGKKSFPGVNDFIPSRLEDIACPLEIRVSKTSGRYMRATRNIPPGEILLVEPPIVLASRPKSEAHCSTCFKSTNGFKCADCGFFFCGPECLSEDHKEECIFLRRLGTGEAQEETLEEQEMISERLSRMPPEKHAEAQALLQKARLALQEQKHQEILQQYVVMAALRTLLKIRQSDFTNELVFAMQGNVHPDSQRYNINKKVIVDVIVERLRATTDSNLVHQICSIWDTNAFQVILPQNNRVQGLFPFAALFNHNCRPNAQQWFTSNGSMMLRAVEHIGKGDEIAVSYTDPKWCTIVRQNHLQNSKQFTCTCKRCYDPTEGGTFLGSLVCPKCGHPMVSSSPLVTAAPWVCTSTECSETMQASQILSLGAKFGTVLQKIDPKNVTAVMRVAKVLQKQVHSNHYSLQQHYITVTNTLTNRDLTELSAQELSCYSEVAARVLNVLRVLEPKLSRVVATLAREELRLHLETLRRKQQNGEDVRDRLKDLSSYLQDCMKVLDWDRATLPSSTPLKNVYNDLINAS